MCSWCAATIDGTAGVAGVGGVVETVSGWGYCVAVVLDISYTLLFLFCLFFCNNNNERGGVRRACSCRSSGIQGQKEGKRSVDATLVTHVEAHPQTKGAGQVRQERKRYELHRSRAAKKQRRGCQAVHKKKAARTFSGLRQCSENTSLLCVNLQQEYNFVFRCAATLVHRRMQARGDSLSSCPL